MLSHQGSEYIYLLIVTYLNFSVMLVSQLRGCSGVRLCQRGRLTPTGRFLFIRSMCLRQLRAAKSLSTSVVILMLLGSRLQVNALVTDGTFTSRGKVCVLSSLIRLLSTTCSNSAQRLRATRTCTCEGVNPEALHFKHTALH